MRHDAERLLLCGLALRWGCVSVRHHQVDGPVADGERILGVLPGVIDRRVSDRRHEGRRLGQREFVEILGEVLLGGRTDAVGVGTEEHRVRVELEDLVLRVALLEFCGDLGLADLALERAVGRQIASASPPAG